MSHSDLTYFTCQDPRLTFLGKWQEEEGVLSSFGTICFVKAVFTGDLIGIKGKGNSPVNIMIDGEIHLTDLDGIIYLQTIPGLHRLVIQVLNQNAFSLEGIFVESLIDDLLNERRKYIKFIGDSISNAYPGFVATAASLLDCDYSNDSVGGMSLTDGWGWPKEKFPKVGMESFYFRTSRSQFDITSRPYAFRYDRSPCALVVFLGTNDYLDCPEDKADGNVPIFAEHYSDFIQKLASFYTDAAIYILEPLSDKFCRQEGIESAFARMKEALSSRVTLIPCHTWQIALSPDGTHPSSEGYTDLGIKLAHYLSDRL